MRNTIIGRNYKQIIPIIHFLLSFFWEKKIFIYSDNLDVMLSIPRNDYVSDKAELIITYVLSRIFALLIIWLFWKLVFYILEKNVKVSDMIVLGMLYFTVLIAGVILFPGLFGLEIDNFTNYLMAIRFIPTYWQSIYTGALYAGCLMVIPHPISLFLFQWSFFFLTVSYIYLETKKLYPFGYLKYTPLLLFLIPESYYLTFNSYRNNYYAVLVMFYVAYLFFTIKNKENQKSNFQIFAFMTAFLMVWRSEGILIGVGGLMVYTFFYVGIKTKEKVKKIVLTGVVTLVAFVGISRIQNIGSEKYYGQDYMILNTTPVLYSIFNNPNADFSYSAAETDLQAIETVIPVEIIREYGMEGYRDYNWTNGHLDFNQTLATDEAADKYMHAYYSIILHNPGTYLDVQINNFYISLQLWAGHTIYGYNDEKQIKLESFVYDEWHMGMDEVMATGGTQAWNDNYLRRKLSEVVTEVITVWRELVINSGINLFLHAGAILSVFSIMIRDIIDAIDRRSAGRLGFVLVFIILFGEMAAVMLFMPEGRAAYMYPVLYASYLLLFLYLLNDKLEKKTSD